MLQDVRGGTSRDIDRSAITSALKGANLYDASSTEERAFMEGVRSGYDSPQSRTWLADVIKDGGVLESLRETLGIRQQ